MDYFFHEHLAYTIGVGITGTPEVMMQRAINPIQLFMFLQPNVGYSGYHQVTIGYMPTSFGIGLAALSLIGALKGVTQQEHLKRKVTIVIVTFAVIGAFLCTYFIPWNIKIPILRSIFAFISKIQFPWRFLSFSSYLLLVLAAIAIHSSIKDLNSQLITLKSISVVMTICCLLMLVF
nr:hypothetical protein [Olegusella massiliensis]